MEARQSCKVVRTAAAPVVELVAGGGEQLAELPLVRQHRPRLQVEAPAALHVASVFQSSGHRT